MELDLKSALEKVSAENKAGNPAVNTQTPASSGLADEIVAGIKAVQEQAKLEKAKPEEPVKVETPAAPIEDSSLKVEDKKIHEPAKVETPAATAPPVVKSFEEELIERFGGKVKSVAEIEEALKPKPSEIANDFVAKINELAKQGVEFNDEFWYLQSKDFNAIKDPEQILLESMKLDKEYKGWTEKELRLEIEDKYKKKEWADDGEDPTDAQILAQRRLLRDAEAERQKLIQKQELQSLKPKEPTQAEKEAVARQAAKAKEDWDKFIDNDVVSKRTKLSTLIDEKTQEVFDFEVPEADKQRAANILKQLPTNVNAFFDEFKKANGEYDYAKMYDMLVLKSQIENYTKIAAQNFKAKGREEFDKNLKNIDFKTDGKSNTPPPKSVAELNAEKVQKAYFGQK